MKRNMKIHALTGSWPIRAAGAVIAETQAALEFVESDYDAVIYFPRNDIAMTFLDYTDKMSHCPNKGYARCFSIITKNEPIKNRSLDL